MSFGSLATLIKYLNSEWNYLPLVLNAIGAAIGKPLWPFDIGDVEAEMTKYQTKSIDIFSRIEETDNSFEMPIGFIL